MSFVSEERKRHTVYPPAEHVFTWTQMCDIRDVSLTVTSDIVWHRSIKHFINTIDQLLYGS